MGYPGSVKDRLMRRVRSWTRHILRPAVISIQDVRLAIDPTVMSPLMVQVLYDESYESVEREIVENHLDDDDTVLELGAGIGYIGVCAAKKIGPHRVFCVEPNPRLIPLIAENQRLNSIVFEIYNSSCGCEDGEEVFFIHADFWTSSTFSTDRAQSILVQKKSIHTLQQLVSPTFLVVDIEGGEWEILRSACLKNIKKICVEVHPAIIGNPKVSELIAFLIGQGFVLEIEALRERVLYFHRPICGDAD